MHYFRAHLSAAPLKYVPSDPTRAAYEAFPRSSERGPVEVRGCAEGIQARGVFPRSSERGPVEAGSAATPTQ